MKTTTANAAVQVGAGGDDMLSKWQLLAENVNRDLSMRGKPLPKAGKDSREQQ